MTSLASWALNDIWCGYPGWRCRRERTAGTKDWGKIAQVMPTKKSEWLSLIRLRLILKGNKNFTKSESNVEGLERWAKEFILCFLCNDEALKFFEQEGENINIMLYSCSSNFRISQYGRHLFGSQRFQGCAAGRNGEKG